MTTDRAETLKAAVVQRGRYASTLANGFTLEIDGATAYRVRLLPSNKEIGRSATAAEAARLVELELAAGRDERTLALDWCDDAGRTGKIAAGHRLTDFASRLIVRGSADPIDRGGPS